LLLQKNKAVEKEPQDTREIQIPFPKIAVIVTLLVFFGAQIQTYFNPNLLQTTNGKIANEIFFHLSVVCFVIFSLLLFNLKSKLLAKISSVVLLLQTSALAYFAYNSDWNYVVDWGLTHKRLYGFSSVALVISLILVFTFCLVRKSSGVYKYLSVAFCLVLAVTNLINFDYLIYRNPPLESGGIELDYVSRMSLDSYSVKKEYEKQSAKFLEQNKDYAGGCSDKGWLRENYNQIEYLQKKYSQARVFSFNWNEYQNWLQVRDIKLFEKKLLDNRSDNSEFIYNEDGIASTNPNYVEPRTDCYFRSNNSSGS
jgi:hypothetical protein